MLNRFLFTAILGLSLTSLSTACRDDKDDGGSSADGGNTNQADAAPGTSTTIYDVQSDATPAGSSVSLRSVVVTAIDTFGGRTGGFYVQETEGGAFSGVFVFGANSSSLAVGDLVNIDGGIKDEFSFDFEDGHSVTQVVAPDSGSITVSKVGDGTVPAPEEVNPWDLAADDAEAEKWEGVLIKFTGARALGSAFNVSRTDETLLEMSITGPYRMGGSLADLGDTVARDDCFGSITGIGDYFFNYKILPRSSADMVNDATGESCLAPEVELLCEDTLDNDYDGFADCADRSCQDTLPACTTDATVVEAQNGTVAENSRIRLNNVVVTALAADGRSFWVQDSGGAAAFNGLFVFQNQFAEGLPLPATIVVGRVITLAGRLDEFNTLTELVDITIESTAGILAVETLDGIAVADLASEEQYEGVLVSLPGATVATGTDPACSEVDEFSSFSIVNGASPLFADEDIFCHTTTAGQCYGTFDGIMHYDDFNDRIVVLPLEEGLTLNGGPCT